MPFLKICCATLYFGWSIALIAMFVFGLGDFACCVLRWILWWWVVACFDVGLHVWALFCALGFGVCLEHGFICFGWLLVVGDGCVVLLMGSGCV